MIVTLRMNAFPMTTRMPSPISAQMARRAARGGRDGGEHERAPDVRRDEDRLTAEAIGPRPSEESEHRIRQPLRRDEEAHLLWGRAERERCRERERDEGDLRAHRGDALTDP